MTALAPRPRTADASAAALVDAAIGGDEHAWQTLCERHEPQVRAVAHARLRDHHAAEDVVQETMLRAWTRLHQVEDADRLAAWLKTIAANVAIDHVRRHRAMAPLSAAHDHAAPLPSHDDVVVAREEAELLHTHLGRLREVDRQALWQRDGHGVPVREVAADLGMTTGSVRVLLSRARRQVRDGYGLVAAPLVGLTARWRARWAGLGDAVPVAVAAPAVVIAVVTGVVLPSNAATAPPAPVTSIAVAPTPTTSTGPAPTPATPAPQTVAAAPIADAPTPAAPVVPREDEPAARGPGPGVDLGAGSAGFADAPPTEHDRDDGTPETPAGPVEGVEVYLEETGLGDLGQSCSICP